MSEESPNSLKPPKVSTEKMKKWPLYVTFLAVLSLFGVLFYSVNYGTGSRKEAEKKPVEVSPEKPLATLEGHGLSLQPPANTPAVIGAPESAESRKNEPLVVVRDDAAKSHEEVVKQERERQRAKDQAYMTALSSPLIAKRIEASKADKKTETASRTTGGNTQTAVIQQPVALSATDNQIDPNASDRDKEQFFNRSGRDEWLSPHTREAGRPCEIKTGTVIPGIMVSGINSDLPGSLIAQVSQNVYDTATGHHLLIPQGSKLYGIYDSRVVYGQSRVLVAWNRLNFPDGSSVTLDAMPGTDISGYAGYEDQVNNHYLRIFGSSLLMSMITGGTSYAMDSTSNSSNDSNSNDSNGTTVQDSMAAALASQMGQSTMSLLQKNLNIKPTLEIRPGYQFNVIVTKDVVFQYPYARKNNG